jgi:hypothetical protein
MGVDSIGGDSPVRIPPRAPSASDPPAAKKDEQPDPVAAAAAAMAAERYTSSFGPPSSMLGGAALGRPGACTVGDPKGLTPPAGTPELRAAPAAAPAARADPMPPPSPTALMPGLSSSVQKGFSNIDKWEADEVKNAPTGVKWVPQALAEVGRMGVGIAGIAADPKGVAQGVGAEARRLYDQGLGATAKEAVDSAISNPGGALVQLATLPIPAARAGKLGELGAIAGRAGEVGKIADAAEIAKAAKAAEVARVPSPAIPGSAYSPEAVAARLKPKYETNPAHEPGGGVGNPRKTPEPKDAEAVYQGSVRGDTGTWYGKNDKGEVYRFQDNRADTVHFNGIIPRAQVPNEVLKQLFPR